MSPNIAGNQLKKLALQSEDAIKRCEHIFGFAQVGRCVGGIVHDINNYLGVVMAYAELVEFDEGLSDESRRMLQEIGNSVAKSSELLNTLTITSRLNSEAASMVDPNDIIRRVLDLRLYALRTQRIEVETTYAENPPSIVVNVSKFQMALLLLLMNAQENIELQREDGGKRTIQVSVSVDQENAVTFSIKDSGPESSGTQLFEPFNTTHEKDHLGLGLSQAREIAHAHNGTLTCQPGNGFVLALPRDTGLML